jgi:hypothetical protein
MARAHLDSEERMVARLAQTKEKLENIGILLQNLNGSEYQYARTHR